MGIRNAAIYEEISRHPGLREYYPQYAHKIHFLFLCHPTGVPVKPASELDLDMVETQWADIDEACGLPLYPTTVRDSLRRLISSQTLLFLGSEYV